MASLTIKLRKIKIKNFKAIDSLELEFPAPVMGDEPDVFVMGSKNGIGKTSVLESCALLLFGALWGDKPFHSINGHFNDINICNLLVRVGEDKATIEGEFVVLGKPIPLKIEISRSGKIQFMGNTEPWQEFRIGTTFSQKDLSRREDRTTMLIRFWEEYLGRDQDPRLLIPLLHRHRFSNGPLSYIKLKTTILMKKGFAMKFPWTKKPVSWIKKPVSSFKLEIIRLMTEKSDLFENIDAKETQNSQEKSDFLLKKFTGGVIGRLEPFKDNAVDVRIFNLKGTDSFTFDGLGSGQKEIISTLYLIWKYTRKIPSIVLIDVPELHLNYEWHFCFIQHLHEMAPDNQYIIATH